MNALNQLALAFIARKFPYTRIIGEVNGKYRVDRCARCVLRWFDANDVVADLRRYGNDIAVHLPSEHAHGLFCPICSELMTGPEEVERWLSTSSP